MAKSDKRQKQMAAKRASKDSRYRAALAKGDQGGKSKYQQKMQRKLGKGRVDPRWMWWMEGAMRSGSVAAAPSVIHGAEAV